MNGVVVVYKGCWLWERNHLVESEGAFLLVCGKEGTHNSLLTTCQVVHHCKEKPLGQVGVLRDCKNELVTLLNVANSSFMYRYSLGYP